MIAQSKGLIAQSGSVSAQAVSRRQTLPKSRYYEDEKTLLLGIAGRYEMRIFAAKMIVYG